MWEGAPAYAKLIQAIQPRENKQLSYRRETALQGGFFLLVRQPSGDDEVEIRCLHSCLSRTMSIASFMFSCKISGPLLLLYVIDPLLARTTSVACSRYIAL